MFKVTQRYLASNFIAPFLMSTIFFVTFLLTFQLFRITKIIINKGVGWLTVIELVTHIAISFLPMAIPLSALFATMYTLNKMSEDSEIVAMRSFGMTKWQLFKPFLILGLIISTTIFSLNKNLIPFSKTKFKNTIIRLTSRGMLSDIKAENFFTDIPGVTLFAEKVVDGGKKMEDVFIQVKSSARESIIFAKKGVLVKQAANKWGTPTLRLNLRDGNIVKTIDGKSEVEKIIFKEYDFPVLTGGSINTFVTKDSMRTLKELETLITDGNKDWKNLKEAQDLDSDQQKRFNDLKRGLPKSKLEYWSRFNTPFQCLIFILIGFALGIKKGRGRSKNSSLIGILVLIGYYAVFFTGVSLARKWVVAPWLVITVPSLITLFIGSYYYKKLDWAS